MRLLILSLLVLASCVQSPVPVPPPPIRHQIYVSWQAPKEYSSFELYRSTDNKNFIQLAAVSTTKYTDTNVQIKTTYYYKAKTYCNRCTPQTSNFSNVVHFTIK